MDAGGFAIRIARVLGRFPPANSTRVQAEPSGDGPGGRFYAGAKKEMQSNITQLA